jgi:hypothetical protein
VSEPEFIEVVPAMAYEEADAQFETWCRERLAGAEVTDPDDVRVDLIRSENGESLKRYRVRRSLLERKT